MIVLFCTLLIIGLCHCNDLPSNTEVESSINRTINEVERLIRENSTLPHLTKREIIDILFNITSKDLETYQNKKTIEEARNIYQKALMVVLPYNAEDAIENVKDLHTKPPVVQLITDPFSNSEDFERSASKNKKLFVQSDKQSLENVIATRSHTYATEKNLSKENSPVQMRYKNHRETSSEAHSKMPLKETLKFDSTPIKFSFNLENLPTHSILTEEPTTITTTTTTTTTKRPVFEGSSLTKNKEVYIVYSTSATTISPGTIEMKKNVSAFNSGPETTSRPLNNNEHVLSVDKWRYNAPTTQSTTTVQTVTKLPDVLFNRVRDRQPLFPITASPLKNMTPTVSIGKVKHNPDISKVIATSEKIEIVSTEQSAPIYVTPMSFSSSASPLPPPPPLSLPPSSSSSSHSSFLSVEKLKYNSTYNLNSGGFHGITTTTTTTMRPEVMELLASIGLRPENAINVEDVFKKNMKNLEIKSEIPNSNGLVYATSGLTAITPDSPSIIAQNTFENPVSEIGKGMNNLTPDVQLLFQRFGLQTSNLVTTTMSTLESTINTNSYTNFKPLPTSKIQNEDMKEFLAKFGLGVSGGRQKKAMSASTERPSLIEAVPDNMRQILENIGLISRKISRTTPKIENAEPTKATKFHVFKPHEVRVKDEEQRMKINQLLDKVRLVQEGKASIKDVRNVADRLVATTKTLKDGPDPLNLEEIIRVYNEDVVKNEVKRQQNPEETIEITTRDDRALANTTTMPTESVNLSSTTTTTTATVILDSTTDGSNFRDVSTATPESSTASVNLAALEESFGGTTRAPDPVLPTKRRNGLYFLLDWNTFLEVGDEDSEKVNLRFEPKVGDRTRFLPVSVP
ncbi:cell wall protein DAN4 [Solenopsis invicta]|uniref:cell wall protein DAN4 n=1 Tax=Solenopsis invicta TaxID=13686 RepID=UPI000595ED3E|nr:cell wall protein DAN4 [Solenopsis invicta]